MWNVHARRESADGIRAGVNPAPADAAAGIYPILLLGALVFISVFPWHAVNQRLPVWDSADFVLTAQKITDAFDERFSAGVAALYLERGWRPIVFPTVAAPFFLLTGGQIRISVGLAQFASALILALYIYCFLRQECSSVRALTGSLLITGAPWLVNFSNFFFSELFWLAATTGVVYHLSAAVRRSSRLHYVLGGVWLGLMGATRPIETVVLVFVPVLTFLAYASRRGTVSVADMAAFALQLLGMTVAVTLLALPERHWYLIVSLLAVSFVIIGLRARRFLVASPFLAALVSAELIAMAWHLPTIRLLYLWVQETSFGSLAQVNDQRFKGLSPLVIFGQQLEYYSSDLLLTLAAMAVPAALWSLRRVRGVSHSGPLALITVAALMLAPMLVLYSWSGTSDPRRIMPGMLILYMGVTALTLAPHGLFPRVRLVCGLSMAVALMTAAAANGLNVKSSVLLKVQGVFGYLRQPATVQDPNGPVLESILQMGISNGNISAYTRCYRNGEQCDRENIPWFEPMALSTLARERHVPLYVHYIYDLDFSKPETLSQQISLRNFQYVLVDMVDPPGPINRADPYARHTEEFIAMERTGLPPGLTSRGCFSALQRPICVVEVAH